MSSSIPLMVVKKLTELVKPSKHIPSHTLSLSTLDNDPFNEVAYKLCYVYKTKNVVDDDNQPEFLLREALSNLLGYYYPLSGRLKRRESDRKFQLNCGGDGGGVPFTVATANVELPSLKYLENIDSNTILNLFPELQMDNDNYPPFALQVTKFGCGGFVLGMAMSHAVCDGFGVGHIMCALAELAGGKKLTVTPIWERERLVGKPDIHQPGVAPRNDTAASPYLPTNDWVTEKIIIKTESIRRLKEKTMEEYNFSDEGLSTFEVLSAIQTILNIISPSSLIISFSFKQAFLSPKKKKKVLSAYLWKLRVKALSLEKDGVTILSFAVGIRNVVDPPLPDGYYGNAYIDMNLPLTVGKVDEYAISDIVKLIKEEKKKAHDKTHLKKELGNIENIIKTSSTNTGKKDGLYLLTDWRNIGIFGSMNFGWDEPVNVIPLVPPEIARVINFFMRPSNLEPTMVGGIQVMVTLPRGAMTKFKEELKAIN